MKVLKPTIGIVMPLGSQQGGAEALLRHLLQHGSDRCRWVCAYFEDGLMVEECRRLGYDTAVIPTKRLSSLGNYFRSVLALRRWIKSRQVDVLLSWMPKAHLYGAVAALGLKTKVVWYQHGVPEGDSLDRIATRLPADAVLCCSRTSQAYQDRMVPKRKTLVSYPGIARNAEELISKCEARRQLDLPKDDPIVLMVARLERWKGVHVFIAAAAKILQRYPDAMLVVVGGAHSGDPEYAEELARGVEALNRPGQFILAGQKSMDEVMKWQCAADLIVHPVTGVEAFGMAVPEAMACGRVVIASNEGGPSEVIEDGVSGVLVPKDDPDKLADAVVSLLADPIKRGALEIAASRRAAEFSVGAFAARLSGLLLDVLNTQKGL
jgi:glycosyltransferase involved in cell wall biosynthesis